MRGGDVPIRRIVVLASSLLTVGAVAAATVDPNGPGNSVLFATGSMFALAFVLGPVLHGVQPRHVWAPQTLGAFCLFTGTFWPLVPAIHLGPLRFFDLLYFAAYPLLVLWLVLVARHVRHRDAALPSLDAAGLTAGALLAVWAATILPVLDGTGRPAAAPELLYPMVDATLVGLAVHITLTHRRPIPSLTWFIVALSLQLVLDVVFSAGVVLDADPGPLLRALTLVPYFALAMGATHPSIVDTSRPPVARRSARRTDRLTATVVFMIAPVILSTALPVRGPIDVVVRTALVAVVLTLLYLRMRRALRALTRAEHDSHHRATHDMLTGLLNRAALLDALEQDLATSATDGRTTAVLFLDCDGFKQVNDSWGHRAGDDLLRGIARRLYEHLDPQDVLARHGGDEFVVMRRVDSPTDAVELASTVRRSFDEPFPLRTDLAVSVTPSIGVAVAEQGMAVDEILARADAAMYAAKQSGRGRYAVHESA